MVLIIIGFFEEGTKNAEKPLKTFCYTPFGPAVSIYAVVTYRAVLTFLHHNFMKVSRGPPLGKIGSFRIDHTVGLRQDFAKVSALNAHFCKLNAMC